MITDEQKREIDKMDYKSMLAKWRFSSIGDPFFQDERGQYFAEAMKKKRIEVGDDAHVAASKDIGW